MNDVRDMEPVLEAILFVANEPVSRERLLEVFDPGTREDAAKALDAVVERYRESPTRGVLIDETAGGFRFVTRPNLHGYLRRFYELTGSNRLSMPALETLAIIAYRQPVTAPEIQELRGVGSSGVLKTLLERRLVRIAGRKEVVGKPFLYATTREFLMRFGLGSLKDLPPLEQFEEFYGLDVGGDGEDADGGHDHEEEVLRQAAMIEEQDSDTADAADIEAEEAEVAAAEATEQNSEPSEATATVTMPNELNTDPTIEPEEPQESDRALDDEANERTPVGVQS